MPQTSGAQGAKAHSLIIYTDGGCDPNPGPGGWGAVLLYGDRRQEICGSEAHTTNNRMELSAAIEALKKLRRPCDVTIVTDSTYVRNGITQWIEAWQASGWRRANGAPVQNADLWQQLLGLTERHRVNWRWTRGHAGDPLNERADALAALGRSRALQAQGDHAPPSDLESVTIYPRASALGAPGPAGYAAAIARDGQPPRIVAGSWDSATINAAELYAAIKGLQQLKTPARVRVVTASKYVLQGATRWLARWERNGWRTSSGSPVEHRHLWEELARVMGDHDIQWEATSSSEAPSLSAKALERARQAAETRRQD